MTDAEGRDTPDLTDPAELHRRFLEDLHVALGWERRIFTRDESDVVAEIRRLRLAAGEQDESLTRSWMEMLIAESAQVVKPGRPDPMTPRGKAASLWIFTRAGTVEGGEQLEGGEVRTTLTEQPRKSLTILIDEGQVRRIFEELGDLIGGWDGEE